jgi:hypothetical protein
VTNNVVTVAAGSTHSLFHAGGRHPLGMGKNSYGQLGTGPIMAATMLCRSVCAASRDGGGVESTIRFLSGLTARSGDMGTKAYLARRPTAYRPYGLRRASRRRRRETATSCS